MVSVHVLGSGCKQRGQSRRESWDPAFSACLPGGPWVEATGQADFSSGEERRGRWFGLELFHRAKGCRRSRWLPPLEASGCRWVALLGMLWKGFLYGREVGPLRFLAV